MRRFLSICLLLLTAVFAVHSQQVESIEYWVDNPDRRATGSVKGGVFNTDIDMSGVSDGMHLLTYRIKDNYSRWSAPKTSIFFKHSGLKATTVQKIEYWVDSALKKFIGTMQGGVFNAGIDMSAIADGMHLFTYRVQDNTGVWSSPRTSIFFKHSGPKATIVQKIEYWVDSASKKTTGTMQGGVFNAGIDMPAIADGMHLFTYRAQDNTGIWSAPRTSIFFKHSGPKATTVQKIEYWVDSASKKTTGTMDGGIFNADIDMSGIADGIHLFTYRVQDNTGIWSAPRSSIFFKDMAGYAPNLITAYEYWTNENYAGRVTKTLEKSENPHTESGILQLDSDSFDRSPESISFFTDSQGKKYIGNRNLFSIRFRDSKGKWSDIFTDTLGIVNNMDNQDLSGLIVNPSATLQKNGWTTAGSIGTFIKKGSHYRDDTSPYFCLGNTNYESWDASMSQTIEGLPAGTYLVSVKVRGSENVNGYICANDSKSKLTVTGGDGGEIWFDAAEGSREKDRNGGLGFGWNKSMVQVETDGGPLTIALLADSNEKNQWIEAVDFELYNGNRYLEVYGMDVESIPGDKINYPVYLDNYVEVTGLTLDITFPEDFIVETENIITTGRISEGRLVVTKLDNGVVRLNIKDGKVFEGSFGKIIEIPVILPARITEDRSCSVSLSDCKISVASGDEPTIVLHNGKIDLIIKGIYLNQESLDALVAFNKETGGSEWIQKWTLSGVTPGYITIPGVTANWDGYVTSINLHSNNLNGIFPNTLFNFPALERVDISGNALIGELPLDVTTDSSIKRLDISDNSFSGNIGGLLKGLGALEVIKAAGNMISDITPSLPERIKELDFTRQTIQGNYEWNPSGIAHFPTLIENVAMIGKPVRISIKDSKDNKFILSLLFDKDSGKVKVTKVESANGNLYEEESGYKFSGMLDTEILKGSTLPLAVRYSSGDNNFSGTIDVADMQNLILEIFGERKASLAFNLKAADLASDGRTNVRDLVLLVEKIHEIQNLPEARKLDIDRRNISETDDVEVAVYWSGNNLVIETERPVGAFSMVVSHAETLDWTGLDEGFTISRKGSSVIVYSLSGSTLPVGRTIVAKGLSAEPISSFSASDNDGSIMKSEIRSNSMSAISVVADNNIGVFARNGIIYYKLHFSGVCDFEVTDLDGHILSEGHVESDGSEKILHDTRESGHGIYFIKICNGSERKVVKIII